METKHVLSPYKTMTLGKWLSLELWFLSCKIEFHYPVVDVVRLAQGPKSGW